MAKFSYLPENKRYKIIHLKEDGYSMRQIAAKVPCGLSTVVRTLKRFSETNFIADRGRSGRPRKTSLREDRTVRGRLLGIGLRGCKARPKPLLTEFQRKRRLTWATEHSLWTIKYWKKVIFSDESQFCISGNQSSAYVRRRTREEFSPVSEAHSKVHNKSDVIENATFNRNRMRLKLNGELLGMIGMRSIRPLASPVKSVAFLVR
ncbi:uncharacterized protein TNCV_3809771 [Trichonephila clavipes]|nr:uncharacterized protein TNCV_3809771 [Trichonephila clavipes]